MDAPTTGLVRAHPATFTLRQDPDDETGTTMAGRFAVFNEWTEIESVFEGHFMERIAPRAFRKTIREQYHQSERSPIQVLFNHGTDPDLGDKSLGQIESLSEDGDGVNYEVRLFDNVPGLLVDGLRANVYGSSFKFRVMKEDWDDEPDPSEHNERGLPERTIREVNLYEFGPVTFPAYAGASAGVRSMTDRFSGTPTRDREAAEGTSVPQVEPQPPAVQPPPALPAPTHQPVRSSPTMIDVDRPMTEPELRESVEYLDAVLRDLDTRAGDHPLTPEDQESFDEGMTLRTVYAGQLETIERRKAQLRQLAAIPTHVETSSPDPLGEPASIRVPKRGNPWDLDATQHALNLFSGSAGTNELRSRALSAVEHVSGLNDRQRQHITTILDSLDLDDPETMHGTKRTAAHIVAVSSPEYMRAWSRCLKAAIRGTQHEDMRILSRAMSLTTTAGGFAVPLPVDPTLVPNYDVTVHPFRQISTVRSIVTTSLRTVNSTGATFSWDGEAAEVSDDSTTFANIDIATKKAQGLIPFSIEIGEDYPGFTEDVRRLLQDGKDNLEATAFATGTGANQPQGIVTALVASSPTVIVTSTTTDTFAVADLYKIDNALASQWRSRAVWVGNKTTFNLIRQFGTSDSHALWTRLGEGQPERLLGYPVYEAEAMDGVITALGENYMLILGDFRAFYIVDRVGFSMELVPHLFATANNLPSGQRAFYAYWRVGSDSTNDRALRVLNVT